MITKDGEVVYAMPSHQEKAMDLAMKNTGLSRDELIENCPKEYLYDWMRWLLMQSGPGSASVWNDFCLMPEPTKKSIAILKELKINGLYVGSIPRIEKEERL